MGVDGAHATTTSVTGLTDEHAKQLAIQIAQHCHGLTPADSNRFGLAPNRRVHSTRAAPIPGAIQTEPSGTSSAPSAVMSHR